MVSPRRDNKVERQLTWPLLQAACAQALADPENPAAATDLPSTLFVGLSGGVDSVVLLDLAMAWQAAIAGSQRLRIVALHAHHGLQEAADAWLNLCVERCAALGIELISTRLILVAGQRSEAGARSARYDFYRRQLLSAKDCLVLAHHADDQAETLLLRVAQGRSVQGMPQARRLGQGLLVRPLLTERRLAIEAYAQHHQLRWVEDPTNAQLVADRNFIRHQWLPVAVERWSDLVPSLAGLADRQRQQADLSVQLVASWPQVPVLQARLNTGPVLLRAWLFSRGEVSVSQRALEEFCAQLEAPPDRSPTLRLDQGELRRYGAAVHYVAAAELKAQPLASHYEIASSGQLRLPHGVLSVMGPSAQLQVRFAQNLDPLVAQALKGRHWHRAQVPPWLRPSFPQLFIGQRRLGVPALGAETLLPRALDAGTQGQRWAVRWQPFKAHTQEPQQPQ